MSHLTTLQLAMLADGAITAEMEPSLTDHLDSCADCQAQLRSMQEETTFITAALQMEASNELGEITPPKFSRPASLKGFALANIATGLVIWLAQFLWKTIFGELIVNATTWVTSIYLPDIYAMTNSTALYLLEEGTAMFDAYLGFVVVTMLALTVLWLLLKYRRANATTSMCLVVLTAGLIGVAEPVHALEVRQDEGAVTIGAAETIDDTLLVAADTVFIDGVITGDLVALGRSVDISGTVQGNLVTFAETIVVRGEVGGLTIGAGSSVDLRGANVGGNLWLAGETLEVDDDAQVGGNAVFASQRTTVDGSIGKDLYAAGETLEVSGNLGEDLEAFTANLKLLGDAHVSGNVRFRTNNEDKLHRADNVRVDGEVEFLAVPEALEDKSPYATVDFYLWQIARFIGAFLMGLAVLWAVPAYRSVTLGRGVDAAKTIGIGLLTLISTPIIAVLVAITLVGLPLSLLTVAAWILAIYLAKIIVAATVGRMLLSESDSLPITLGVGLLIMIVAINLPFIGGIISFFLTLIGLGLIVQHLLRFLANRNTAQATAA